MKFTLQDFLDLSDKKKEIRHTIENVNRVWVHIFHYMIATPDLFKEEIERECRGITFDDSGKCICRPFHKFFNIGEREETLPENINWNNIRYITHKLDGSLVTPVVIDGKVIWKSKKTFYSDIAKRAQNLYDENSEGWKSLISIMKPEEYTLLFEYVAPDNKIVLEYKDEQLLYLGKRHIETGIYEPNVTNSTTFYTYQNDYKSFISHVKGLEGIEGYCIYTKDNQIYKLKTEWYLSRHRLLSSISYKYIFKLIEENKIDDLIAELRLKGQQDKINLIESIWKEYNDSYDELFVDIYEIYNYILYTYKPESKKEFAKIALDKYKSFSALLFALYDNTDNFYDMFNKFILYKLTDKYKGETLFMGNI